MAVDLSEFEEQTGRRFVCHIAELDLTEEQRAKLDAALARPGVDISTRAIHRVLQSWDRTVAETTIGKHRQHRCQCYR